MALYIPHSIFHLARVLFVRSETFGTWSYLTVWNADHSFWAADSHQYVPEILTPLYERLSHYKTANFFQQYYGLSRTADNSMRSLTF